MRLQKGGPIPSTNFFFGIAFLFSLDVPMQKKRRRRILEPTQIYKEKQDDP